MNRFRRLGAAGALLLACTLSAAAQSSQDQGPWRADSSNAKEITGDIAISPVRVFINFSGFTIAQIHKLTPAEGSALSEGDEGASGGGGNLYRLNIPAAKKFLHHNTLCGSDDTQWMATFTSGRQLAVAFFSGSKMPELTIDALANSTDHCGTFIYQR